MDPRARDAMLKTVVPQFADLMVLADDVCAEYRKRKGEEPGQGGFDDSLTMIERVHIAQALTQFAVMSSMGRAMESQVAAQAQAAAAGAVPQAPGPQRYVPTSVGVGVAHEEARTSLVDALPKFRELVVDKLGIVEAKQWDAISGALVKTEEGFSAVKMLLYEAFAKRNPGAMPPATQRPPHDRGRGGRR